MLKITLAEYKALYPDYAGVWSTERFDLPNWPEIRFLYVGKRYVVSQALMLSQTFNKTTCLLIEGLHFEIIS